jgi:hypothetical protein
MLIILEREYSHRSQCCCLAPLQQILKEIFLNNWMESDAVRDRTLEFLDQLDAEENGGNE